MAEIFDVARDPDVTSPHIICPQLQFTSHTSAGSCRSGSGAEQSRAELSRAEQGPGPRSEPAGGIMWLVVLAGLLHCASTYDVDLKKLDGLAKARVEVK